MLACLPVLLSDRDFFIQQKTQQHYEYHHHQKTSYISFEMKVALSTSIIGLERWYSAANFWKEEAKDGFI